MKFFLASFRNIKLKKFRESPTSPQQRQKPKKRALRSKQTITVQNTQPLSVVYSCYWKLLLRENREISSTKHSRKTSPPLRNTQQNGHLRPSKPGTQQRTRISSREQQALTSNRCRGFPGSRGGGCARHSDAAILLTAAAAAAPAPRGATASPGQRSGGVAGGGACAGAGAGARRAEEEAREGLWTRSSRRPRRGCREEGDAWRGVAAARPCAALAGDLVIATGDERRGRAMSSSARGAAHHRDGAEGSGIAANSARMDGRVG